MGCATSTPLVNGGGPGGLVESTKTAATDVIKSGETALNEISDNVTESINNTKESIVDTVQNISSSLNDKLSNGEFIPLKDADESVNHALQENLENLKNDMLTKTQILSDETDKMADELIKETEDVLEDVETVVAEAENEVADAIDNSSNHSADSLKTTIPEPEIERLLMEATSPPSPEPTMTEDLNAQVVEAEKPEEEDPKPEPEVEPEVEEIPVEPEQEAVPVPVTEPEETEESTPAQAETETPPTKENDLVVEDVKSDEIIAPLTNSNQTSYNSIGIKRQQNRDFDDDDDFDFESTERPKSDRSAVASSTAWESLHDLVLKQPKKQTENGSQESLLEDLEIFFDFAGASSKTDPTDSFLSIPRSNLTKSDTEYDKSDYENGDSSNSTESDESNDSETEDTRSKTSESISHKNSTESKPERPGSLSLISAESVKASRTSLKSTKAIKSTEILKSSLNASQVSLKDVRTNAKSSKDSLKRPSLASLKSIDSKKSIESKKSVESKKYSSESLRKSAETNRQSPLNNSRTSLKGLTSKVSPMRSFDHSKKPPLAPQNTVDETIKIDDPKIESSRTFIVNSKKSLEDLKRSYSGAKKSISDLEKTTEVISFEDMKESTDDNANEPIYEIIDIKKSLENLKKPLSATKSIEIPISAGSKHGSFVETLDKSIEEFEKSLNTFEKGLDDITDSDNNNELTDTNDFSDRTDTIGSFGLSDIMEYSESSDSTPSQDPTLIEASEGF